MNALFVMWRSTGHVNASLGVAQRLTTLGNQVTYVGPSDLAQRIEVQGFRFYRSCVFDEMKLPVGIGHRPRDLAISKWRPLRILRRVREVRDQHRALIRSLPERLRGFDELLDACRPDFVVFDPFLLYFHVATYARRIPCAALSTKSLATRDALVPPYTSMTVPNLSWSSQRRIALEWVAQKVRYRVWAAYERALFGLTPYRLARSFSAHRAFPLDQEWATRPIQTDLRFKSVTEWVLYPPEFDFPRSRKRVDQALFIGPCVDRERKEPGLEGHRIPAGRLLLCVLTSVHHPNTRAARLRDRFVIEVLHCMRTLPEFALAFSVGRGLSIDSLGIPPNVTVSESLPTLRLLRQAELLIFQGGGNIAKEAIMADTRLLTCPAVGDQPGLSARLAYHGISRRIRFSKARACTIREMILATLADGEMERRVMSMGEWLRTANSDTTALNQAVLSLTTSR